MKLPLKLKKFWKMLEHKKDMLPKPIAYDGKSFKVTKKSIFAVEFKEGKVVKTSKYKRGTPEYEDALKESERIEKSIFQK